MDGPTKIKRFSTSSFHALHCFLSFSNKGSNRIAQGSLIGFSGAYRNASLIFHNLASPSWSCNQGISPRSSTAELPTSTWGWSGKCSVSSSLCWSEIIVGMNKWQWRDNRPNVSRATSAQGGAVELTWFSRRRLIIHWRRAGLAGVWLCLALTSRRVQKQMNGGWCELLNNLPPPVVSAGQQTGGDLFRNSNNPPNLTTIYSI